MFSLENYEFPGAFNGDYYRRSLPLCANAVQTLAGSRGLTSEEKLHAFSPSLSPLFHAPPLNF